MINDLDLQVFHKIYDLVENPALSGRE